jgi:dephospho-CoA kinase
MRGQPCYDAIVQHFGKDILGDDGEINRKALGEVVFNSKVLELACYSQTWR